MLALTVVEEKKIKPNTTTLLPWSEYKKIIVSFSGGKDSLACVLRLLKMGVPRHKIELWHQEIDGCGAAFMDWPITPAYCRAVAKALGIRIRFQWKVGGFEGELLREESLTQPTRFELEDGSFMEVGGVRGELSTRRLFPQKAMDLSVRWCSAYLKIDVFATAIRNDPALKNAKVCVLTGERRQEGKNGGGRALYAEFEEHRASNKSRRVDGWRAVIDFTEEEVWSLIREYGIIPHPAYYLGWGRVSCITCIFGLDDQWASVRKIAPAMFDKVACYEMEFGKTITRGRSVVKMADAGTPYPQTDDAALVALAMGTEYNDDVTCTPEAWVMPAGAFSSCGGPI